MAGHHSARSRRTAERKGDVRERAILDTCEHIWLISAGLTS
jgi:hypothetical protein